ncbi:MAG: YbjQ family protein [Pseudomonadota bacterium]
MTITNTEQVPGFEVAEHLGMVQGSTVRAKHVGRDIMAGLKNIVGGELRGYTELMEDARGEAIRRMQSQAAALGADAVVNVRLATSTITQGAAELLAYGTAVKLKPLAGD